MEGGSQTAQRGHSCGLDSPCWPLKGRWVNAGALGSLLPRFFKERAFFRPDGNHRLRCTEAVSRTPAGGIQCAKSAHQEPPARPGPRILIIGPCPHRHTASHHCHLRAQRPFVF